VGHIEDEAFFESYDKDMCSHVIYAYAEYDSNKHASHEFDATFWILVDNQWDVIMIDN